MKIFLNKLMVLSTSTFLLLVCMSWKADTYSNNALTRYLDKENFTLNEKTANRADVDKLLKVKYKKQNRKHGKQMKNGHSWPTSPTIYYYLYEQPTPYMDANLKISVNRVEQRFEFWSTSDSVETYADEECPAFIEIEEPIFLAWDANGYYHIKIESFDGYSYSTVYEDNPYVTTSNTPNYSGYWYQYFYAYYGYDYYITVSATSY